MEQSLIIQINVVDDLRDIESGYQEWLGWGTGLVTAALGLLLLGFLARSIARLF